MATQIEIAGVNSLLLRFSDQPSDSVIAQISQTTERVREALGDSIVDLIPSYTSLLLTYDLQRIGYIELLAKLQMIIERTPLVDSPAITGKEILLPVCYDAEYAPDIALLAQKTTLSVDDIIGIHSNKIYRVYAIGFSPGFGYLGQLDPQIQVPRLATPRTRVPAGSVAIAGQYTSVYPQDTPGGWWLIGQCPIPMFDKKRSTACTLSVGDSVQFNPVSSREFQKIKSDL